MARPDFSHAWVVCNGSKTGRKRESRQSSDATELLTKKWVKISVAMSFFDVMSEVQKDSQDVSTGLGQF
jgi:hypothetical protein